MENKDEEVLIVKFDDQDLLKQAGITLLTAFVATLLAMYIAKHW